MDTKILSRLVEEMLIEIENSNEKTRDKAIKKVIELNKQFQKELLK